MGGCWHGHWTVLSLHTLEGRGVKRLRSFVNPFTNLPARSLLLFVHIVAVGVPFRDPRGRRVAWGSAVMIVTLAVELTAAHGRPVSRCTPDTSPHAAADGAVSHGPHQRSRPPSASTLTARHTPCANASPEGTARPARRHRIPHALRDGALRRAAATPPRAQRTAVARPTPAAMRDGSLLQAPPSRGSASCVRDSACSAPAVRGSALLYGASALVRLALCPRATALGRARRLGRVRNPGVRIPWPAATAAIRAGER